MVDPQVGTQASLILFSIVSGAAGAVLGLGGGTFIVPLLTLIFGVQMKYAVGASTVSLVASSLGSGVGQSRNPLINIRLGIFLAVAASIGTGLGGLLTNSIAAQHVFLILSLLLLISTISMLKREGRPHPLETSNAQMNQVFGWGNQVPRSSLAQKFRLNSNYFDARSNQRIRYSVSNVILGFILMMTIGLFTGLLGIGCGALRVPVMDKTMKVPFKVSAATSNFMIGITSAVGAIVCWMNGMVLPSLVAPVTVGILIGSWGGSTLSPWLPNRWVHQFLIFVLFILTIQMGIKTWALYFH